MAPSICSSVSTRRSGDQTPLGQFGHHGGHLVEGAEHLDPVHDAPDAPAVARQDAGHAVAGRRPAHGADEQFGPVAVAGQQHRHAPRAAAHPRQAAVLGEAIEKARPAQKRDQHEPVDDRQRTGEILEAGDQEQDRHEGQDHQGHRAHQGDQVVDRGIAPDAAIEAHGEKDGAGHRDEQRGGLGQSTVTQNTRQMVAKAQPQRQRQRQRRHHQVVDKGDAAATKGKPHSPCSRRFGRTPQLPRKLRLARSTPIWRMMS